MSATFFKSSAERPWKAVRQAASATEEEIAVPWSGRLFFVVIIIALALRAFLPGLLFELAGAGDFGIGAVAEIVKERGAVSFSPEADFAGLFERVVLPDKSPLAVEGDNEIVVLKIHAQSVPLV